MNKFVLLFLIFVSCSVGTVAEIKQQDAQPVPSQTRKAPTQPEYDASTNRGDACVPDEFTADNIPSDYKVDWNCPPRIYDPPRWIPPWDPGPVIKK